jgi:hypothetical protein
MKLLISEQDYHRILSLSPEQRVTLSIDANQVLHPEVVSIHRARTRALERDNSDFFFTGKQCVESLEIMHEIEIISEWDSSNFQEEGYDPAGHNLEILQ